MKTKNSSNNKFDITKNWGIENFKKYLDQNIPLIFPIKYKDKKYGEVEITIKPNKEELKTPNESMLLKYVKAQLPIISKNFKEDIELELKYMEQKFQREDDHFTVIYTQFPWLFKDIKLWTYLLSSDEEIFEIIRNDGPIALRNINIQAKMKDWLNDKHSVGLKINKLRDTLMEYAGYKNKLFPQGRPKKEYIRGLGTEWIIEFYEDIRSILSIVKKKKRNREDSNINEIFKDAHKDYIFSKKEALKKGGDSKKIREKIESLNFAINNLNNELNIQNAIALFIQRNKDLNKDFEDFRWEPNKFAKEILSKMFKISISKIEKILYTSKNKE